MITLDDCIEFCDMPPAVVEKIAAEHNIPLVLACGCAHGYTVSANDGPPPAPPAPNTFRMAA